MTDTDDPLDLGALAADARTRAERITAAVTRRVAEARAPSPSLAEQVRRDLARFAIPAMLAAAASLALALTGDAGGAPLDRIARVIVPPSPLGRLVIQDRQPEIVELMVMMEPGR